MSPAAKQLDHDPLPGGELTVDRARQELSAHRDCPTSICRRKAQAKALLAFDIGAPAEPAPALPAWVRPGARVVELSQTRGIVLSRLRITAITGEAIILEGGYRYPLATMHTCVTTGHTVFTRQNPYLPNCRLRLAAPDHPEAR
ncbi:hypothetical protein ABZ319_31920 [Nocardia sp. NPDC005978]|uniref:hypothetical protein n=1 Tax=Nocardia sp. NPDC005978 TaxID=3156725 RepID=UPI00339EA123